VHKVFKVLLVRQEHKVQLVTLDLLDLKVFRVFKVFKVQLVQMVQQALLDQTVLLVQLVQQAQLVLTVFTSCRQPRLQAQKLETLGLTQRMAVSTFTTMATGLRLVRV
jgi:hypothetical protein